MFSKHTTGFSRRCWWFTLFVVVRRRSPSFAEQSSAVFVRLWKERKSIIFSTTPDSKARHSTEKATEINRNQQKATAVQLVNGENEQQLLIAQADLKCRCCWILSSGLNSVHSVRTAEEITSAAFRLQHRSVSSSSASVRTQS